MKVFQSYLLVAFAGCVLSQVKAEAQCTSLNFDENEDRHVDTIDMAAFVDCFAGPGFMPDPSAPRTPQECLVLFEMFEDEDVDLLNFRGFQNGFTGSIRPECYNIVFISSQEFFPNLGGVAAYDQRCNMLATQAGFYNPVGNAFMAWISSAQSNANARLGANVRGFVRPDGIPVANTSSSLINANAIFNPIHIDERGVDVGAEYVMTGTTFLGDAALQNCTNWTSTAVNFVAGHSLSGPGSWTNSSSLTCNQGPFRIYCFQKTSTRALPLYKTKGKIVYLTQTKFAPGAGQTPDQLCDAQKPPGVGAVRAMIATTGAAAADVLVPEETYVRVDGQLVGSGEELISAGQLSSGIWQDGNGVYVNDGFPLVWTGHHSLLSPGTVTGTCNDWTQTVSAGGVTGQFSTAQGPTWWNIVTRTCSTALHLYCVER